MLRPLLVSVTEMTYSSIINAFDLENASVDDRIKRLINISPDDLVAKTPMTTPLVPFLDGDIVPELTSFKGLANNAELLSAGIPGYQWCEDLMIGDCQHDVSACLIFSTI